jgi:hypothetical protein
VRAARRSTATLIVTILSSAAAASDDAASTFQQSLQATSETGSALLAGTPARSPAKQGTASTQFWGNGPVTSLTH